MLLARCISGMFPSAVKTSRLPITGWKVSYVLSPIGASLFKFYIESQHLAQAALQLPSRAGNAISRVILSNLSPTTDMSIAVYCPLTHQR